MHIIDEIIYRIHYFMKKNDILFNYFGYLYKYFLIL